MQSDTLLRGLNESYSVALYGSPGRLPALDDLRVVWPHALSAELNQSLTAGSTRATSLVCRSHWTASEALRRAGSRYLFMSDKLINHAALWVHQPARPAPAPAVSYTWIEVTHCAYRSRVEGITGLSPMWFYATPGSGLSINVGRTLAIDHDPAGPTEKLRLALTRGYANRHNRTAGGRIFGTDRVLRFFGHNTTIGGERIDTVQFVNGARARRVGATTQQMSRSKGRLWWTTHLPNMVVTLRWGRELDYVASHLKHFQCGRHPHLRPCRPGEAALEAHGPACASRRVEHALCGAKIQKQ